MGAEPNGTALGRPKRPAYTDRMAGAIALILAMIAIPVVVLMSGAVASAILGESLRRDGIARNEGSELLELED